MFGSALCIQRSKFLRAIPMIFLIKRTLWA